MTKVSLQTSKIRSLSSPTLASLLPRLDLLASRPHLLFLHVVGEVIEEGDNVVTWRNIVRHRLTCPDHVHERVGQVSLCEVDVTAL